MWATLTLMTALGVTPGQASALQMTNTRVTYGMMGPTRTDQKFVPGDTCFISFDIEGLKKDKGRFQYSMKMELLDGKGKTKFTSETEDREVLDVLNGNRVPALAHSFVGIDQEPGEYTLKITVSDRLTRASQTLSQKFVVGPKDFGLVGVQMLHPGIGRGPLGSPALAPPVLVVGQAVLFSFAVVGFDRDKATKQPKVEFAMRVLDDSGKPTLEKPIVEVVSQGVDESVNGIQQAIDLALTRAGKFTVELKATDLLSKKTSTVTLPITVLEAPK
jgi:hypothetical protein